MAELLKNLFSKQFVEELATDLKRHSKNFDEKTFVKNVLNKDWVNRELKDRMHHITFQMHENLPLDFREQILVLNKSVSKFSGFTGTIFPNFVEQFGKSEEKISLEALKNYTQYSTSEFAIRPFLKQNPKIIEVMYDWSKDKNHHVRRLSSEGCRPLLPWAMKLEQYVKDPKPILPILERLNNDKEDYVYRSVANNLNDISKNHPELVLDLGKKWTGKSETTEWVLKHALRTLLKKGEPKAMKLFGFESSKSLDIIDFSLAKTKLEIGEFTSLNIKIKNTGAAAKFRLEYAVSYLKKNGSHNDKVFQICEKEFAKNQEETIVKKVDFKDLSTRKHHAGKHFISLKINGVVQKKIEFALK
jgi:3-methyladenine DNA glycosylase AlkC